MEITIFLRYDAADHGVCRQSRICGCGGIRQFPCGKARHRGRGYPGIYPVCAQLYAADQPACADFQHAAVDGGGSGACV